MEIPSEIDTSSCEGLTRLLCFAIKQREDPEDRAALALIEKRFRLPAYEPQFRGALDDFARHLAGLDPAQRFSAIYSLISGVLGDDEKLAEGFSDELLQIASRERVVRFSFTPSLLVCLRFARDQKIIERRRYYGYTIRYAGIGPDKALMASASLFLNLPIYTETGFPWAPDMLFEDDEPNVEQPDYEISFPPPIFKSDNAPQLEASVRKLKLPRAVDRRKYDLESVMLYYLAATNSPAAVFVSEPFLSSTKLSRLLTRQNLITFQRIRRVLQLRNVEPPMFIIELAKPGYMNDTVDMGETANLQLLISGEARSRRDSLISYDDIYDKGQHSLKPSRYFAKGPTGGKDIMAILQNKFETKKLKLVELFEIIRPKTTKNNPVGLLEYQEIGAGNITPNGEVEGGLRRINLRSTQEPALEAQVIKVGDILLAHRGRIGRVAYVTESVVENTKIWAGQTLLIIRERKISSSEKNIIYCDPRVLFMYLLTAEVRDSWLRVASGDKNPSIPIGEVESFGLPESIVLPKKPRRSDSSESLKALLGCTDQILSEFDIRQNGLLQMREMQANMDEGLDQVWNLAWTKPKTKDEH